MKSLQYLLLSILFLLQGTKYSLLIIGILLFLIFNSVIFKKDITKLKLPYYYIIAIIIYLFYLIIGILNSHDNIQIDVKFQLYGFLLFLYIIKFNKVDLEKFFFFINIIVFITYTLLYFNLINNIWSENTFGYMGRVYGPVIIAYVLLSFIYLFKNRKFDMKLGLSFIVAIIYVLFTTNFMNLLIVIGLTLLNIIDLKKVFKIKYVLILLGLSTLLVSYVKSPYATELIKRKASYIFAPWEYGSVQTRIQDFNQAITNNNFGIKEKLIGVGYGASTIINRGVNSAGLEQIINFQEIDNGFYYLYHRGGWTLLLIFFMSHIWLFLKLPNLNSKLGFILIVFVTNILSIHYFNYYFYLIIPFIIISEGKNIAILINRKKLKLAK